MRLITASGDPSWAFASIAETEEAEARIRHVGDRVGSWRVDKIEWDRVWFRGSGARCAVGMHAGAREAQEELKGTSPKLTLKSAEQFRAWEVPPAISQGIDKLSETEYSLTQEALDGIFARGAELLASHKLSPLKRDERVVGIVLDEIQPDSLLERLGLLNGDIVTALNEDPCDSLTNTAAALERAREKRRLLARLERGGELFTIDIAVR